MAQHPPASAVEAIPLPAWHWAKSLGAAAWPLLCALVFAAYAFFPERFPEQTWLTLYLLGAAELPMILLGLVHAAALAEPTVKARLKFFFIALLVLALMAVTHMGLNVDLAVVAPMLLWVLVPYVIDLSSHHADPALASRQAAAVLEDRLHMITLIPILVMFGVLLAIVTVLVLVGISVALGTDLLGKLGHAAESANPSLLALVGSAYLLIGAASAAHVHRPVFLRDRKAF